MSPLGSAPAIWFIVVPPQLLLSRSIGGVCGQMNEMNFWLGIPKPIIGLSPMDGVTDFSFRSIIARHGRPDVIFTEFVSIETAFHAPHSLLRDFAYSEAERPVLAQLYGHTPDMFYKAAQVVCELGFDGVDINMGCPAKKVAAKGSGAALIRTPDLARQIIRAVKRGVDDWAGGVSLRDLDLPPDLIDGIKAANVMRSGWASPPLKQPIPVSVKTRIGYDEIVVESWIETLLGENLAAITLHGRTLEQQYRGAADWQAIARAVEIARHMDTLVLGNGDVRDMSDAARRIRDTGVDGVLIGRASQGNPWLFRGKQDLQRVSLFAVPISTTFPPSFSERAEVMLEHARHFANHRPSQCFVAMRKHLAWYCYSMRGAAELRARLIRVNSVNDVADLLAAYADKQHAPSGTAVHDADLTSGCYPAFS
jgi:nifR3 family TIM-barrel protein